LGAYACFFEWIGVKRADGKARAVDEYPGLALQFKGFGG
jgi:hypothetical protein